MNAWIIYYRDKAEYNRNYIDIYKEEGKKLGIDFSLVLIEDLDFGVKDGNLYLIYKNITYWERDEKFPDFLVFRAIYPLLSKHLELMGMKVYNNSFVADICNDKAKTYQYLARTGIPMVDSLFYKNNRVENLLQNLDKPTVIKAVDGHGGSQVFLLDGQNKPKFNNRQSDSNWSDKVKDIVRGIGNSDVVLQPLVGKAAKDLRVYVIGTEIIAAVMRTAKDGFRANFSLGGNVSLYRLSKEERQLVNTIIEQFEFGLVGIDFIIGDNGQLIFNEIEDVVGSRMLYQCSDINIVELYLKFIIKDLKIK